MKIQDIFIVDDDQFFLQTLEQRLSLLGDFKIHQFLSAEEALAKAKEITPQVIFLDYHLQKMDGIEALTLFRALLPTTTLALLSSHVEVEFDEAIEKNNAVWIAKNTEMIQKAADLIETVYDKSKKSSFWKK